MLDMQMIVDFTPVFNITNKFNFLQKWPYNIRQKLIAKGKLQKFSAGE
jgi:hypothetical protein